MAALQRDQGSETEPGGCMELRPTSFLSGRGETGPRSPLRWWQSPGWNGRSPLSFCPRRPRILSGLSFRRLSFRFLGFVPITVPENRNFLVPRKSHENFRETSQPLAARLSLTLCDLNLGASEMFETLPWGPAGAGRLSPGGRRGSGLLPSKAVPQEAQTLGVTPRWLPRCSVRLGEGANGE